MNINNDLCPSCFAITAGRNPCPYCGYDRTVPQAPSMALPLGTILNGQYLVGRVLGQGGFGITYLGFDLSLKCRIAIKEFFPSGLVIRHGLAVIPAVPENEPTFQKGVDSFYQEASILARFRTVPNIVSVFSFFRDNRTAYFIMEYLDGQSLKEFVLARGGRIPTQEAVPLLLPIINALEAVHFQGLLHRDVSPDNIFLMKNGVEKLLDFGAARFTFSEKTQSAMNIIKPGYAPPEQYSQSGNQGTWTDVYALGGTLYRIVTGKLPTEAPERAAGAVLPDPCTLQGDIPPYISAAILKAMRMEQRERYQTVMEFRSALLPPQPVGTAAAVPQMPLLPMAAPAAGPDGSQAGYAGNDGMPITAQRRQQISTMPDSAYLNLQYGGNDEKIVSDEMASNGNAYLFAVILMGFLILLILYTDRNGLWCDWFRFLWSAEACAAYGG